VGVSDDVKEIFLNYDWPGNVRELKNVIEGAFNILSSRYIEVKDLPNYLVNRVMNGMVNIDSEEESLSLDEKIERYEKQLLIKALKSAHTYAEAAIKLGISKQSLNYKLHKYNLK